MIALDEVVINLPQKPGVYLMKDGRANVIYVGKASSLRNRVKSYFTAKGQLTPKTIALVKRIRDIDYFVTSSEQEALILEYNLIQKYRPLFNIELKDGKSFPYLKVNFKEDWPRFYVTRRLDEDGGRYFGPFASAGSIRRTLNVLKEMFPFRSCSKDLSKDYPRPCLEYDIHRCLAPCVGVISKKEYADVIHQVLNFLEGKNGLVVKEVERKMNKAAGVMDYERAAIYRDQLAAVRKVIEGQQIATRVRGEQDVIAVSQDKDIACAQVFFIRGGKLVGRDSFTLRGVNGETLELIITNFVKQFYNHAPHVPPLILLQYPIEDETVITKWLSSKRKSSVVLKVPRRSNKKKLMDIVAENAVNGLKQLKIKHISSPDILAEALAELKDKLNLPSTPQRMEGYDISNIQGTAAVGSMVVFIDGKPDTAHYRRFRIKTVEGADDYAMIKEVVSRRFSHYGDSVTNSWAQKPDLVLIDGGKGQLASALKAMKENGAADVPIVSLAKENEEVFLPDRSKPIPLPLDSPALSLLRRLRDEAHRFAVSYHRKLRSHRTFKSVLDNLPGIGPSRKRNLIKKYGSVAGIRRASISDLAQVININEALARQIKELL
jgi:excinuclease ABC subunit C